MGSTLRWTAVAMTLRLRWVDSSSEASELVGGHRSTHVLVRHRRMHLIVAVLGAHLLDLGHQLRILRLQLLWALGVLVRGALLWATLLARDRA